MRPTPTRKPASLTAPRIPRIPLPLVGLFLLTLLLALPTVEAHSSVTSPSSTYKTDNLFRYFYHNSTIDASSDDFTSTGIGRVFGQPAECGGRCPDMTDMQKRVKRIDAILISGGLGSGITANGNAMAQCTGCKDNTTNLTWNFPVPVPISKFSISGENANGGATGTMGYYFSWTDNNNFLLGSGSVNVSCSQTSWTSGTLTLTPKILNATRFKINMDTNGCGASGQVAMALGSMAAWAEGSQSEAIALTKNELEFGDWMGQRGNKNGAGNSAFTTHNLSSATGNRSAIILVPDGTHTLYTSMVCALATSSCSTAWPINIEPWGSPTDGVSVTFLGPTDASNFCLTLSAGWTCSYNAWRIVNVLGTSITMKLGGTLNTGGNSCGNGCVFTHFGFNFFPSANLPYRDGARVAACSCISSSNTDHPGWSGDTVNIAALYINTAPPISRTPLASALDLANLDYNGVVTSAIAKWPNTTTSFYVNLTPDAYYGNAILFNLWMLQPANSDPWCGASTTISVNSGAAVAPVQSGTVNASGTLQGFCIWLLTDFTRTRNIPTDPTTGNNQALDSKVDNLTRSYQITLGGTYNNTASGYGPTFRVMGNISRLGSLSVMCEPGFADAVETIRTGDTLSCFGNLDTTGFTLPGATLTTTINIQTRDNRTNLPLAAVTAFEGASGTSIVTNSTGQASVNVTSSRLALVFTKEGYFSMTLNLTSVIWRTINVTANMTTNTSESYYRASCSVIADVLYCYLTPSSTPATLPARVYQFGCPRLTFTANDASTTDAPDLVGPSAAPFINGTTLQESVSFYNALVTVLNATGNPICQLNGGTNLIYTISNDQTGFSWSKQGYRTLSYNRTFNSTVRYVVFSPYMHTGSGAGLTEAFSTFSTYTFLLSDGSTIAVLGEQIILRDTGPAVNGLNGFPPGSNSTEVNIIEDSQPQTLSSSLRSLGGFCGPSAADKAGCGLIILACVMGIWIGSVWVASGKKKAPGTGSTGVIAASAFFVLGYGGFFEVWLLILVGAAIVLLAYSSLKKGG